MGKAVDKAVGKAVDKAATAVIFFSIVSRFTFCCCNSHMHSLSNMLTVFMYVRYLKQQMVVIVALFSGNRMLHHQYAGM